MIKFNDAIEVTFFRDAAAKKLGVERLTLPALRDRILQTTAANKQALPWLKLSKFGDTRSDAGSLRHNGNVLYITGCEADYDGEQMSFAKAVTVLRKARLRALIYTSPSHTDAAPRWRILAPTAKDRPAPMRGKMVARLDTLFGGGFAHESYTLSQAYYFGGIKGRQRPRVAIMPGICIDEIRGCDAKTTQPALNQTTLAPTSFKRRDGHEPIDRDLIAAALEVISTDLDWVNYRVWLEVGAALHAELGDAGFELFERWSATSAHYNAAGCARKWRECRKLSQFYTGGTVLHYAHKADPHWRGVYQAKMLEEAYSFMGTRNV